MSSSEVGHWSLKNKTHFYRGWLIVVGLHVALFASLYWGDVAGFSVPKYTIVVAQLVEEPLVQHQSLAESSRVKVTSSPAVHAQSAPLDAGSHLEVTTHSKMLPSIKLEGDSKLAPKLLNGEPSASNANSEVVSRNGDLIPQTTASDRQPPTMLAGVQCSKPEYPTTSRRREEEGTVLLKFLIGVQGQVLESIIEKSSGFARLDEAARDALAQCQFKPGSVDGKPEPSWAHVKYTWRLE